MVHQSVRIGDFLKSKLAMTTAHVRFEVSLSTEYLLAVRADEHFVFAAVLSFMGAQTFCVLVDFTAVRALQTG